MHYPCTTRVCAVYGCIWPVWPLLASFGREALKPLIINQDIMAPSRPGLDLAIMSLLTDIEVKGSLLDILY